MGGPERGGAPGKRVGQLLGNYRLVSFLGQGGQAEVYLGEHMHLGTHAAIKVLHAEVSAGEEASFRQEAQMIAHLRHPNIVRVLDYSVQETVPFLVMDYAQGGTLRSCHPVGTRVALANVISYVTQAAGALQYAHNQKVVHRDLKPENLLLGFHQQVLLSDFGIALLMRRTRLHSTQQVVGTAGYMAPEQWRGHPCFASDQYAFAVIVYEWLCGERPFQGSFAQVASGHLYGTPLSLRQKNQAIPVEVERVVLTALAKDPQARFESIQAFATALEEAAHVALAPTIYASPAPMPARASVPAQGNAYKTVVSPGAIEPTRPVAVLSAPALPRGKRPSRSQQPRAQVTGLIRMVCGSLIGLSILLWLMTSANPKLHSIFALMILFSLALWIAAYADHRRATEKPFGKGGR